MRCRDSRSAKSRKTR